MHFFYHEKSGSPNIDIDGDLYRYIFKARREKCEGIFHFRNLHDSFLYSYKVTQIAKKSAAFTLIDSLESTNSPIKEVELFWCATDPKTVEKTLPMLNEIGLYKLHIIECQRSQKSFRYDLDRMRRILINSCEQCGRADLLEITMDKTLQEVLEENENIVVLDFIGKTERALLEKSGKLLVGCEGGFSDGERELFRDRAIYRYSTPLTLKSETAVVAALSLAIL